MEHVELVAIRLGHQLRIWYLNLTGISEKTLKMMGFKDLLKETTAVDFTCKEENKPLNLGEFFTAVDKMRPVHRHCASP